MGKARDDSELLARINAHPKGKHFRDLEDVPAPIFNARISQAQQHRKWNQHSKKNTSFGSYLATPVSFRESGLRSMSGVSRNY